MTARTIKCLVWDLDGTLWDGILSEGDSLSLKDGVADVIRELDRRGILLSVASKNQYESAMAALRRFGLDEYFLVPQISWSNKSDAIAEIARRLNLKLADFAFIDDNPAERDEVKYSHPEVTVIDAAAYRELPGMERFMPPCVTGDSARRRLMYQSDLSRDRAKENFSGSDTEFLKTLGMKMTVSRVREGDLERVWELTVRTHQLNSTGYTYSIDELRALIDSPDHLFYIASLNDKYGDSGKIGLALVENGAEMTVKLLITSCRVMTRGAGGVLLSFLIRKAAEKGKRLLAEFYQTEHNRIMYITYKLAGFEEIREEGDRLLLAFDKEPRDYPDYITVTGDEEG